MSDGVESLEKLPDANTLNQTNSSHPHQLHTRTIETPPRRVKKKLSAYELGTYVYRKGLSTCLDPPYHVAAFYSGCANSGSKQ